MPTTRFPRFLTGAALALFSLVIGLGATGALAQEGYRTLDTPQSTDTDEGRVQVREFFSYGCPHCSDFEPVLSNWTADNADRVEVIHTPITFGRDSWAVLARAYYAADALGILDQTHRALFDAIHDEGRRFQSHDDVAAFYASVADVTEAEVMDALNSFAVSSSLNRAERLAQAYGVRGTPSVGVAGRYLVDVREAGGQRGMLDVADSLVADELGDG
ncbi:thiol:disulfide interchange protein DsbA/DsbL [Spiribacter vilamensis]|uniref:Thiol:disulfide interchange protein n=1 Tax=Spiribacter vilamensis TaxID=531306 RepID=A0A4Q8D2E7_9GAMM|nr:thiol:disulfide interchange protein DsbA/DsbL [Spiribacter vilamensis]RZU99559.1 thiol:disulfide interchange protein DsbA [Spiribacter vilamensis]TVO61472.1 thiol:disulfide interchange protein DsbA/DsbL [Spiribacter vilamensis]